MILPHGVTRTELKQDKEALFRSAERVYAAARPMEYKAAWNAHQAALAAFKAKYGTLRIGPYL